MQTNEKKGTLRRVGEFLGLVDEGSSEKRDSGLVLYGPASAPSSNRTGSTVVTPGDAMSLVGVYRAVSILSTAVKQMPIGVWRGGQEIDTPLLVKKPSVKDNRSVVVEETVLSLALAGNAFWRLLSNGEGEPVFAVEVLNPHNMSIETDDYNNVTGYKYGDKHYKAWEIKHLALLRTPGSHYGLGPIQAAQASLRGAYEVRDYSANWFHSSGVPNGILKTETVLDPDMAAQYKKHFEDTQAAGRGVAVLGNGLSYQPVYLSPADAQFLETQQWNKNEIATLFGVPAIYMLAQGGDSMTYTNVQQVDLAFLKYTLSQYINEIEQAFSDLLPRGQEARFVVEGLLRADRESRFAGHKVALDAGFLTVNEIREIEGYKPLTKKQLEDAKPKAPVAPVAPNENGGQPNDQ